MSTTITSPTPTPRDIARGIRGWLSEHPKVRYTLLFFVVCTVCYFFNTSTASATDTETSSRALDLPLVGVTDTDGVPIWRYMSLPLDPGNGVTPDEGIVRSTRYMIASFLWSWYALPIMLIIAMVEWIVSFEWLSWIAAPFETVADGVTDVLDAWMVMTVAVAVSALWIGLGYIRGRTGAATIEFALAALVIGFVATDAADPFSWMAGSGSDTASESGFIRQAADAGAEAGGMTINQDADPENVTMSGSIIDITLRQTMLNMAFGSSLSGECADTWNEAAAGDSGLEAEEIREEVIECDDAVAAANQTSNFDWMFDYLLAWPAAVGVMFLLGVFLFFLLWQVVQAFISAVGAVIRGYLALFPGNSRTAWLNSLFQVVVSGVLVGVFIFMLTIYMWGLGQLVDAMPAPLVRAGSILIGLLILIAAITFWRMKKSGKDVGKRLAEALGKSGLSKEGPEKKPSNFGSTAKGLTKSTARKGFDLWRDARNAKRLTTGLTAAAAVGTGGVGAAAAKAGSMAAKSAATKSASKALAPGSNLPGVKGALPAGTQAPSTSQSSGRGAAAGLPSGSESRPAPTAAGDAASVGAGPRPVASIPPPSGSEEAPSSPLPRQETELSASAHAEESGQGGPEPRVSPLAANAAHVGPTGRQKPAATVPTEDVATPTARETKSRVSNIPAGEYGGTYVHKNGQMHQPRTISSDGTPVKNIPREDKIARATQSGDAWVTPSAQNLKASSRARTSEQPVPSGAAAEGLHTQSTSGPAPTPMRAQPTEMGSTERRRARPEPVDISARADQGTATGSPSRPDRPSPRPMQPPNRDDRQSRGENQ